MYAHTLENAPLLARLPQDGRILAADDGVERVWGRRGQRLDLAELDAHVFRLCTLGTEPDFDCLFVMVSTRVWALSVNAYSPP